MSDAILHWTPASWRQRKARQMPVYADAARLARLGAAALLTPREALRA